MSTSGLGFAGRVMSLAKERVVIHGRQAASKVLQVIVKRVRIGWTPSVLDRYGRMHEFFDPPAPSALQCVAILCGSLGSLWIFKQRR
jgi:hypothetical protein